jgi:phosphatidylserine decarboxylase
MKIHKEGYSLIISFFVALLSLNFFLYYVINNLIIIKIFLAFASVILWGFVLWFFRIPKRDVIIDDNAIISPADGDIVVIEETEEPEYFKDKRIQVSIFMSPLNVHSNLYPTSGNVEYTKYHPGKFLVAWHPKSSTDNERSTVVIKSNNDKQVLMRQIAGAVARRIKTYAQAGNEAKQSTEMGFIKFGSRVDLFLPIGTNIKVDLNQKSVAGKTVIATW